MALDSTAPQFKFVPRSTGTTGTQQPISLQTGADLNVDLVPVRASGPGAFAPLGITVTTDGSPLFTGQVRVALTGPSGNGNGYRVTGFRQGAVRLIASLGMNILDTLDLKVVGAAVPGMVVLDALAGRTLRMSADQAKVLKDSINGSKTVIVNDQIVALLAALLAEGSVDVLSLMRRGESQHGVVKGSQVFVKAIDINGFKGTPINSNDGQKLVDLICSMLKLFPEGDFDLGFPRPVGGATGFDASHDVFFSVPDLATAGQCFAGTISRTLKQMLKPAQGKVAAAMRESDATFHVFYPDGLNHLHVNVTKTPGIVADLNP